MRAFVARMHFLKLISLICIFSFISLKLIKCTEDDYESDYDISDELSLNDGLSLNESLAINGTVDDYEDSDDFDDEEEDECTVDAFIDHYSELLLPEDYEE